MAGLALASVAAAAPAWCAPRYAVDIPAGPLANSLVALADQTHQQILFSSPQVAGRQAPALKGAYSSEQALEKLLAASGLKVRRMSPDVLAIEVRVAPAALQPAATAPRPFVDDAPLSGAAADPVAPPARAVTTLEEVQVTGTHLRGVAPSSPVVTLSRDALDRSGRATIAEVLNTLPQNFAGGSNEATITTGADSQGRNATYGTGVNLRGLGTAATLVLVNGRRLAGSGLFGDFSDVSSIPTGVVSRVDVLLDGASALYGADAVGGVVNIVLRRDFDGAETRLYAGAGTRGEPVQTQLSQIFGRRWSTGGVIAAYEYQHRTRLSGDERAFAADADLRPLGGSDQRLVNSHPGNILRTDPATGLTVPGWAIPAGQNGVGLRPSDLQAGVVNLENQRRGVDLLPRQTLQSAWLAAHQEIGERFELNADVRWSFRKFGVQLAAPVSNLTVTNANPFFVSPIGATSHSVAYSFGDELANPRQVGSAETWAATLGGTARLGRGWQADGYLGFAQEIGENRSGGLVNSALLSEALGSVADRPQTVFSTARDGFFNPFTGVAGANSPAVLAFISSGFNHGHGRSRVETASLQADGPLFHMPGGDVKLAVGGQLRRETLVRTGSNYTSGAVPVAIIPTDVGRMVSAAYAELNAPVVGEENARPGLERLELTLAVRHEHYDDVGATTNPKVGVLWQPLDGLVLRGSWGTSFRAPALKEVHDAPIYTPTTLAAPGGGRIRTLLLSGGNPDLEPETATSWTGGLDLAPRRWPGLRLSVTGFQVTFRDRIDRPVLANLAGALSDPALQSFVTRISPATNPADRALIAGYLASPYLSAINGSFPPEAYGVIALSSYVNTASLRVRGVDVTGSWRFDAGGDTVVLGGSATWLIDYAQKLTPDASSVERVGIAGFPVKFRGRLTADWTRGPLTAGLAFNYVSAYRDALGARIGAQPTVDLQLRLEPEATGPLRDLTVSLDVRNLFDRDPPFYDNVAGVGFDPTNAETIGRFVAVRLTRRW